MKIPKYVKIVKGHWKENYNYGDVWCKIEEINIALKQLSAEHPKYGGFAWVDIRDCIFK